MNNQDKQIKFLLNQDQANFYKFHLLLGRYYNLDLNNEEYFKFQHLIKLIFKQQIFKLNHIIIYQDQQKINDFMEQWGEHFNLW